MLIIAAFKAEVKPLIRTLQAEHLMSYPKGGQLYRSGKSDILICGMGPVNAAENFRHYLLQERPEKVVNAGTGGILDPDLQLLQIVPICRSVADYDGRRFELQNACPVPARACISRKAPLSSRKERDALYRSSGAALADMELHALATLAAEHGILLSAVKAANDFADENSGAQFFPLLGDAAEKLCNWLLENVLD